MLHQTLPILGQLWQLFEVSQILEFLRYFQLHRALSVSDKLFDNRDSLSLFGRGPRAFDFGILSMFINKLGKIQMKTFLISRITYSHIILYHLTLY